jgi:integrase
MKKIKQQRAKYQNGSVVLDRRRNVWYFRWREDGVRKCKVLGSKQDLPSKAAAKEKASEDLAMINSSRTDGRSAEVAVTVKHLVERYQAEKLPTRFSTRSAYTCNLRNHILPRWGNIPIKEVKPYAVELWLRSLSLRAKTKVHLRGLMSILFDVAMLWEHLDYARNPMGLVKIEGASKRTKEPKSLTVDEFHQVLQHLDREPIRTMVLTAMCLGLRVSELLALKWKDVDWARLRLRIERGAVRNRVDDVKTEYSRKPMPIDPVLAEVLLAWRRKAEFVKDEDWMWASPAMAGEKPLFYTSLLRAVQAAGKKAGLEGIGWHTFRHSYRSWMDETGAPMGVQQKLMRHADIRTTMNVYGDAIPETMRATHGKVVQMALRS